MKRRDSGDRSVAIPVALSGLLGSASYGSRVVDNLMDEAGIRKGLTLNPKAVEALNAYAKGAPPAVHPSDFAYQYAQLANEAGSAQLFNEDPRKVYEWEINSPEFRRKASAVAEKLKNKYSRAESILSKIPGARRIFDKISPKVMDQLNMITGVFAPLGSQASNPARAELMAHTPEMSQSPLRSYVRLLKEEAGQTKANEVVDQTVEALLNYKNPTFRDAAGNLYKPFASPEAYLSRMWAHKGGVDIPEIYKDYVDSLKGALARNPTNRNGGLAWEIRNLIAPNAVRGPSNRLPPGAMTLEFSRAVGTPAKWMYNPEKEILEIVRDAGIRPELRTVQDLFNLSHNHVGLKLLNARAAQGYGRGIKPLLILQKLRSPKLRALLGAGALASGGYGILNFFRNRKDGKRKGLFGI